MIPEHLHRHIVSFLLAKHVPTKSPRDLEAKQRPFDELRDHHHSLSLVSKSWKTVVGDLVNEGAPSDILTPRELAELKSKVFALDLTDPSIHKAFESLIKMKWPEQLYESEEYGHVYSSDPLATIMHDFVGLKDFINMVADEYKRFLVLKIVGILASRKNIGETAYPHWLEQVQPCELVNLFWHAHILSTKKYCNDCRTLVGDIIEYTGPCNVNEESSSLSTKHKLLFQFEQYFLKQNCDCYCRVPSDEKETRSSTPAVLMATRNKLFTPNIDVEKLQDKIEEFAFEMRDCGCDVCCSYCCDDINDFTYSSDEDSSDEDE
jgi:hypothetical protein